MKAVRARQLPLLGAMARDLDHHGAIRPSTAIAMWAAYLTHAALTVRSMHRSAAPLPLPAGVARLAGVSVAGAGVGLCIAGMRRFSGPQQLTGTQNQPLTTTGIYRRSRNPQYLGYLTALTGVSVARRSGLALGWTSVLAAAYAAWAPVEEEHLSSHFGQPYVDYVDRTHRWWGRTNSATQAASGPIS